MTPAAMRPPQLRAVIANPRTTVAERAAAVDALAVLDARMAAPGGRWAGVVLPVGTAAAEGREAA